jgi:cation transporter-like permease|tara:strand:+ start:31 stop:273 length:243 start_codon:yes stop_codon:yes gene_type:complete
MTDMKEKLTFIVTILVAVTLCICLLAIITAMLIGLWAKEVENAEVFKMLSPALMTILGASVGVLAGVKMSTKTNCKDSDA